MQTSLFQRLPHKRRGAFANCHLKKRGPFAPGLILYRFDLSFQALPQQQSLTNKASIIHLR